MTDALIHMCGLCGYTTDSSAELHAHLHRLNRETREWETIQPDADSMGVRVWRWERTDWPDEYMSDDGFTSYRSTRYDPGRWISDPVAEQMARVIAAAQRLRRYRSGEVRGNAALLGIALEEELAALDAMTTTPEAS